MSEIQDRATQALRALNQKLEDHLSDLDLTGCVRRQFQNGAVEIWRGDQVICYVGPLKIDGDTISQEVQRYV